jgi:type II secretory pathway pseudopilin PulG
VSLAIGLVGFALAAVVGALPTGLQTVQDAEAAEVTASIAQQAQASLQQLSFATKGIVLPDSSTTTVLGNLPDKISYFTADGVDITPAFGNSSSGRPTPVPRLMLRQRRTDGSQAVS